MLYTSKLAFRKLFTKGHFTLTRIVSLAVGLAFGILMLSEVFYYYSFDAFYPDAERIYTVQTQFKRDHEDGEFQIYSNVSGGVAPGMKAELPGVEAATRLNSIGTHVIYSEDKKSYKGRVVLADEHLFDVLPRPVLNGNPAEILTRPMACMISSEMAQSMGGEVIGKLIELKKYPGKKINVLGVFETVPENTNYNYDVLVSMASITQFFSWDGSTNWLGNDRYYACVKLHPGVEPESLKGGIRQMQEKYQEISRLEEEHGGVVLNYVLKPITSIYKDQYKDMIIIISTIALAVLFVSLMNYFLLTLSMLINRAKTSAIYKTCGAQANNIRQIIFTESLVLFLISLLLAVIIIWMIKPFAESQLGHSLNATINSHVLWPLLAMLVVWLLLMSYLPALYFSRIPVALAFRSYQQKKNKWKQALLAIQFVGAAFILTLLLVVTLQYDQMKNADHGYRTEGVYYGSTTGMSGHQVQMILNELRSMAEVELVGMGNDLPIGGHSGNNVMSPDDKRELFNIADFYEIDENYLSILDISITHGKGFSNQSTSVNDVLISQKGADRLSVYNKWTDGVIGKTFRITEHGITTVAGSFPDFVVGSLARPDERPSVFFFWPEQKFIAEKNKKTSMDFNILIRVNEKSQAGIKDKIAKVFNRVLPYKDAEIKSLQDQQQLGYSQEKGFRNAMLAGNFVILLVTIIGLLGYTTNEATRRQKELAIRRINGAGLVQLVRFFIIELQYMAAPAVLLGLFGAWFTANRWMQNFAYKIPLHWSLFLASGLLMLFIVAIVAVVNFVRIGNRNPVESLRYE